MRLLLVTDRRTVDDTLSRTFHPDWADIQLVAGPLPQEPDADGVLIDLRTGEPGAAERARGIALRLADGPVAVLIVTDSLSRDERVALYRAGVLACISPSEDPEEVAARIGGLLGARRMAARTLGRLRERTQHLDEQLRLAQRLQVDFLPKQMPQLADARIAARLEPAAWVAGDFYDVFRLDEQHIGFYVADAVGHGIAAALLTVFVKKSLQTKRIEGKRYELIPPDEALGLLNADLLSAELRETPFITMVYGIYNEQTHDCVYARAGHPRPLVLGREGALEALDAEGPLLGIFRDATFEACRRQLEAGQRLLLYSDGAERVDADRRPNPHRLLEIIAAASARPLEGFLDTILGAVRAAADGDDLADDVTLVAIELGAPSR